MEGQQFDTDHRALICTVMFSIPTPVAAALWGLPWNRAVALFTVTFAMMAVCVDLVSTLRSKRSSR